MLMGGIILFLPDKMYEKHTLSTKQASSLSPMSTNEDLLTATTKSPVAKYQKIPGARKGKPGPPCTRLWAIILPKTSNTSVKTCSLLQIGVSLLSAPLNNRRPDEPVAISTKTSVNACRSTPRVYCGLTLYLYFDRYLWIKILVHVELEKVHD